MAPSITCISFLLFISASAAAAFPSAFPAVFNFGDSNSDTGNYLTGLGGRLFTPNGRSYFRKPSGRFSDGRLIVDFLMDAMNLPFLNPYLQAVGVPSFLHGCNFAAAGSTIHPATAASICPFSFNIQVSQFLRFKEKVGEIQAQTTNFSKYIPAEDYFQKALYMFDIGQNDLAGAFYSKPLKKILAMIPTFLSLFEDGIQTLYEQGARNFWIHNTGPLGCLAQNIARFGTDSMKLDEHRCVRAHNRAAKIFNLQLHLLCKKLRAQHMDASITYVDIYTIKSNLIANYSSYGFAEPIMVCCGHGGPPLNYDSRISCGQTKVLNGTSVTVAGCDAGMKYVNWDGIHYTEAANWYVTSQILTGKYSDPPF